MSITAGEPTDLLLEVGRRLQEAGIALDDLGIRRPTLSHPGVAQVHDYGECGPGDTPFLVLELVDGSSLAGVLAAGPLDLADTIDVIAQVAAGLQAAHSAGLVHRDIKPGNLLIGRDGQVKITDFGLASVTGSASVTTTGLVVGTAAYLAPERVAGESATPASDLYSLGVAGYQCLTGRPPFGWRGPVEDPRDRRHPAAQHRPAKGGVR